MQTAFRGSADVSSMLTKWLGYPAESMEGLAELIRAEVTSGGLVTRTALANSTLRRLEGLAPWSKEEVSRAIEELVECGDLVRGDLGAIAGTPLRMVDVDQERSLVISSLPLHILRPAMPGTWQVSRCRRELRRLPLIEARIAKGLAELNGVRIPFEQWCKLDQLPRASAEWLATLDRRLTEEGELIGHFATTAELRAFKVKPAENTGELWQLSSTSNSLWSRHDARFGWVHYWTGGAAPTSARSLRLHDWEACLARYALACAYGSPAKAEVHFDAGFFGFSLPYWLPLPLYRFVSGLSAMEVRAEGIDTTWRFTRANARRVVAELSSRLGVVFENREIIEG